MTRLKWFFVVFLRYYRNLGLRVALYATLALAVAFISPLAVARVNDWIPLELDFQSVMPVLTILASSMLAVSTFSLNIMVSAHRAASAATTPRVHRLLLEDTTTQSVLATFIGAFVYSLTSIILYRSNFYAEEAASLIMGVTILVAALVVVSLLRWIDLLKDLGSVDESIRLARSRAATVLENFAREPNFGATPLTKSVVSPTTTRKLLAPTSGILQLVDIDRLSRCLPSTAAVYVLTRPGRHLVEGELLAEVAGAIDDNVAHEVSNAFVIGQHRTHEQDTEYGLVVLAEIASRALSPGINDPGTAMQTVSALKEVLWAYVRRAPDEQVTIADRVFVQFPDEKELLQAAFAAIARDGAAIVEVAQALRLALSTLADSGNAHLATAAEELADLSLAYSKQAGLLEQEIEKLESIRVVAER
ncbi:DUF2254 domain-containing protein [uncultured Roseobacter sp.]|uniref:DUF2254 domain-containing protein n=1 Tax=uncultured Roseobacter sp. TaxID=114847 RepID=UPI002604849B|nr:DUF2254 domain-containing protein [uncultured Roseobacter sp.]